MAEEHAGIYWHSKAESEFYDLPDESQDRLAEFMECKRVELEKVGGRDRENLAAVWDIGWAVSWDVKLKPQYRKARLSVPTSLGSYYRIEVLEVWKLF